MLSLPNRRHRRRVLLIILIIIGVLALFALALTDRTEAAPQAGNRGGCNAASRVSGLSCTVQDAGVGWVSGTCLWGEYFLAQTGRTFAPGDEVSVSGCVNEHGVITSAPGAPLRISKRR